MMKLVLQKEWVLILLLVAFSGLIFGYNLGGVSLWDESEPMYAEIARQMVETKDWITPHFNGQPWFVHPPLFMWLTALLSLIIGFSEWTARFWAVFFAVGSTVTVYYFGKHLFARRVGVLSALVFATSLHLNIVARVGGMDTALLFFFTLSLLFFWLGMKSGKGIYYYLFFITCGLNTLTKGPVGIVLPALSIVFYLVLTRQWEVFKRKEIILGSLLYFLIALPWYLLVYIFNGKAFLDYVLGYQSFGRYFSVIERQTEPWYYYFGILILGALPWAAFLPYSLRRLFKERGQKGSFFLLFWIAFIFIFFTLAKTKLPNYLLFIYPAVAVSLGKLWHDFTGGEENRSLFWGMNISFGFLLLLTVAAVGGVISFLNFGVPAAYQESIHIFTPLAYLGGGGILLFSVLFFFKRRSLFSFYTIVAMVLLLMMNISGSILPHIDQYKPLKPLCLKLKTVLKEKDKIVAYRLPRAMSIVFYTQHSVIWANDKARLMDTLGLKGRIYYFMLGEDSQALRQKEFFRIVDQKAGAVVLARKI